MASDETWRRRARFGAFVAIAIALQAGPIAIQVLGLKVPLRGWMMFQGKGSDICDVRFIEHAPDGRTSRLTVEQVVGPLEQGTSTPYRLNDVREIRAAASRFCARSGGRALHAVARCGHRKKGWRRVLDGKEDLCRPKR